MNPKPIRIALLIGNAAYQYPISPLRNPLNDVSALKQSLKQLNFEVITCKNASLKEMKDGVNEMSERIKSYLAIGLKPEVVWVYYSGHGVEGPDHEDNSQNFLVPVNAEIEEEGDLVSECMTASFILRRMKTAKAKVNVLLLDACRNNEIPKVYQDKAVKQLYGKGGLGMMSGKNVLIGFATAPGKVALDGKDNMSPYAKALTKHLQTPNMTLGNLFEKVAGEVKKSTHELQRPWTYSDLDEFFLTKKEQRISSGGITPKTTTPPQPKDIPGMAFVKGGTFMMGCDPKRDGNCESNETLHKVTVSSFYLMRYEVTNKEYCEFLNDKGRDEEGDKVWLDISSSYSLIEKVGGIYKPKGGFADHPVIEVTWSGASAYARWYARKTGYEYRLPTEAEWEYAARGGIKSRGYKYAGSSDNLALYGNFCDKNCPYASEGEEANDGYVRTAPVGSFRANELGLYDMSGNVWEWCSDWYGSYGSEPRTDPTGATNGSYRVIRGGSWDPSPADLRVACRNGDIPAHSSNLLGFRLLRTAIDF